MTAPTLDQLRHGDGIRVVFGSRNSQIAMVFDRTRQGNVRVYKYAARSKQWKGPLRITEGEIIGRTREYETASLPPLPNRYYGLKD
jgi:hypothetical protein